MNKIKLILLSAVLFSNMVYGGVIYEDNLDGSNADNWTISRGEWNYDSGKLENGFGGENRMFTSIDSAAGEYTVEFTANLINGSGWGFYFGSDVSANNTVSGMNFQYDKGYSGGTYLLRKWDDNHESVTARQKGTLDLDNSHVFTFQISTDGFTAFQDGIEILSYSGEMNIVGNNIGFRTWSTREAVFSDLTVYDGIQVPLAPNVPEPATVAIATLGTILTMRRRMVS